MQAWRRAMMALAVGAGILTGMTPVAHADTGCTATVETLDDQGHEVTSNVVPCSGGMRNGCAYLYDRRGTYLGSVCNAPPTPDPALSRLDPRGDPDPVPAPSHGSSSTSHSSGQTSSGTSHTGTSSTHSSGCGSTSHGGPKPTKATTQTAQGCSGAVK